MIYQLFQDQNMDVFVQVKIIHIKDNISKTEVFKISIKSYPGNICYSVTALSSTYNMQQKMFQTICKIHISERLNFTLTSITCLQQEL